MFHVGLIGRDKSNQRDMEAESMVEDRSNHNVIRSGGLIIYELNDEEKNKIHGIEAMPPHLQKTNEQNKYYTKKTRERNTDADAFYGHEMAIESTFDEMLYDRPIHVAEKKITVVLDGANIGWSFGQDHFNATGIELAQRYFHNRLYNDERELSIVTFIPSHYMRRKPKYNRGNELMQTDELDRLSLMLMKGSISLVPAGDHDDVYILTYARENNGFVVSNDLFADHIRELVNPITRAATKAWIEENRCGYTFIGPPEAQEFMLNPNSALYTAIQPKAKPDQTIYTTKENHITHRIVRDDMQLDLSSIHALSVCISVLADKRELIELEHALLARAYGLLRHNYIYDCKEDLEYILTQVNSECTEAKNILQSLLL